MLAFQEDEFDSPHSAYVFASILSYPRLAYLPAHVFTPALEYIPVSTPSLASSLTMCRTPFGNRFGSGRGACVRGSRVAECQQSSMERTLYLCRPIAAVSMNTQRSRIDSHPKSTRPKRAMALPVDRMSSSVTLHPNLFQLFHPCVTEVRSLKKRLCRVCNCSP